MIFNVLKGTSKSSVKNDFMFTCKKYLETLNINLTFDEIAKMSKFNFNKISKERMKIATFSYLQNQQSKQEKIKEIEYSKLEIQEYLIHGDRNPKVSKLIYQARGQILDIKMQKKWKFDDKLCSGCNLKEESGQEILDCKNLGGNTENLSYNMFFSEQLAVGNSLMKKLKMREKLREEVT